jgi:hypothetical protein
VFHFYVFCHLIYSIMYSYAKTIISFCVILNIINILWSCHHTFEFCWLHFHWKDICYSLWRSKSLLLKKGMFCHSLWWSRVLVFEKKGYVFYKYSQCRVLVMGRNFTFIYEHGCILFLRVAPPGVICHRMCVCVGHICTIYCIL